MRTLHAGSKYSRAYVPGQKVKLARESARLRPIAEQPDRRAMRAAALSQASCSQPHDELREKAPPCVRHGLPGTCADDRPFLSRSWAQASLSTTPNWRGLNGKSLKFQVVRILSARPVLGRSWDTGTQAGSRPVENSPISRQLWGIRSDRPPPMRYCLRYWPECCTFFGQSNGANCWSRPISGPDNSRITRS